MENKNKKVTRPIMRYHGGKWKLAPWIISHFPEHRVYVEPYGGAASVLLRKPRSYAEVYNDLDGEIVNVFRVMRDQGDTLRQSLFLTPFSREDFALSYYPSEDNLEQARRTIARSFMGHGSSSATGRLNGERSNKQSTGFRSNSNRSGTTPAHDWANFPNAVDALIERLRGVVIENRDALEVMAQHDSTETLHYVDPPYMSETRDPGRDYRHEMTREDHAKLLLFLGTLKGQVIISGYENDLYMNCLSNWKIHTKKALADGANPRKEVLWISPNTKLQLFDFNYSQ